MRVSLPLWEGKMITFLCRIDTAKVRKKIYNYNFLYLGVCLPGFLHWRAWRWLIGQSGSYCGETGLGG